MINISKVHPDPQPLQDFKSFTQNSGPDKACNYNLLRSPHMNNYKRALLEEQHYLCAYCNRNLDEYSEEDKLHHLKIEHWYPQSLCKQEPNYNTLTGLDVTHDNMLIVCPGYNSNPKFTHCDSSRKDDHTLTIKPQDTAYHFDNVFTYVGGILKTLDNNIETDINNELNLNEDMLVYRRNIVLSQFKSLLPPKNQIDRNHLLQKYSTPNRENRLKEYCTLIIYFINNKLD